MEKKDGFYLGIDLGTGSCKAAIINQSGELIGFGIGEYRQPDGSHAWQEQDPVAICDGMVNAVQRATHNAGIDPVMIRSFSLGCALHGLMAVDKDGQPLTGVYTWADNRAAPQAAKVKQSELAGSLYRQTGCPPHGMYPVYKLIWLKENQPKIFASASRFISIKEFIVERLTGEYLVDYSLASGTGLLNTHTLDWNQPSLEMAGISHLQLSRLADPSETISVKTTSLLAQLGVAPGTPLILGSSDAANSNIGAGALSPTQATCMVGTSGAYRIISPQPLLSDDASTWCYCIDQKHWLVGGAINNGGIAFAWLKDLLNRHNPSPSEEPYSFDDLLALAQQSPIGGNGLICLPLFAGERSPNWNLDARAAFVGMSLNHDLRHLCRALLEAIAFRLRTLDEILSALTIDIREVRASGGFTRSDFWAQLICDVLQRPLSIPCEGETSSLGAALWALLGSNPETTFESLETKVKVAHIYQPQPENAEFYSRLYGLFKQTYSALSPLFGQITALQQNSNDQA